MSVEDVSVFVNGDLYATESSPEFRPQEPPGFAVAPLSVPGLAFFAVPKRVKKPAATRKSPPTRKKLAPGGSKINLMVPLALSSSAKAASSSQSRSSVGVKVRIAFKALHLLHFARATWTMTKTWFCFSKAAIPPVSLALDMYRFLFVRYCLVRLHSKLLFLFVVRVRPFFPALPVFFVLWPMSLFELLLVFALLERSSGLTKNVVRHL